MSKQDKTILQDDELIKALEDILDQDELDSLLKAEKSEVKEKEDDPEKEEEKEDDEGGEYNDEMYSKDKSSYDKMKKAMGSCESRMKSYESKKAEKAKEDDLVKGEENEADKKEVDEKEAINQDELVKSITDNMSSSFGEMFKSLNDEISTLKENNEELKKSLEEFGAERKGMKGIQPGQLSVLEKGGYSDEDGNTLLSVTQNKELVEKAIEEAIEEETNEKLVKSLSEDLLAYNAGGRQLTEQTARYLSKNKNIRLGR